MRSKLSQLIAEVSNILLDKAEAVRLAVVCLLADGHLLIEDAPGVGKTTMVQALSKLLDLQTKRIQFTVDLLPADILGTHIYNPKEQEFNFYQGPLFSQLVLADELNRASPRTQSAMLQAMEEEQVSIDGKTWQLPEPFFVIATQNPHQNSGTFPLPESQLDRFNMSLELDYASKKTEILIFQSEDSKSKINKLKPLLNKNDLVNLQNEVQAIKVSEPVAEYVAALLERTRNDKQQFSESLSTRAGIALLKSAKAWAYLEGRSYVMPEDVQNIILPVLGHRLGGQHGIRKGREWARILKEQTTVPI